MERTIENLLVLTQSEEEPKEGEYEEEKKVESNRKEDLAFDPYQTPSPVKPPEEERKGGEGRIPEQKNLNEELQKVEDAKLKKQIEYGRKLQ